MGDLTSRSTADAAALLAALQATPKPVASVPPSLYDIASLNEVLLVDNRKASRTDRIRSTIDYDTIDSCVDCEAVLGLPTPKAGLPSEVWRCRACHAVVVTGETDETLASQRFAERIADDEKIALDQLPASQPAAFTKLIRRLTSSDYVESEKRGHPRYTVSIPAVGIPLNESRRAVHGPIRITTRDLSLKGVSAFSEKPLPTELLLIDFTLAGFVGWQAAVQVKRRRTAWFLHEFGGLFIGE
ncbi:hypothetical protein Pla108_37830 [Botrimarina colliarenosi]|uniref:PilZ domain-containing protein n=1 Tax=Botrimarina colliarenosi TaxID=2528001 RepID=A0A5C6A4U2_9BACT|nr:hypothetical protein [Botrimarina colliarenosi]TWT94071.1 hypothetical protein Pla108_37830 [Botrimarina colliarenosi]